MKKLITIMAAAATALFAFGDVTLPSGTSLEELTAGKALDPTKNDAGTGSDNTYWYLTGDDQASLLVTNYDNEVVLPARPEQFSGNNSNYLKIETSGRLYRSIGANTQDASAFATIGIGDGIYLDTLVQFTPAEDEFKAEAVESGDKIAIEYVEREDDPATVEDESYTNFVVRAGYVDAENSIVATNYYLALPDGVQFDKTAWHRLTVRAISNVGNAFAPVGFVIYVDGTNLVYDVNVAAGNQTYEESLNSVVKTYLYNDTTHALLPSLLRYGETNYDTLSAVAFNGNGSVDDISFTADKPGILPAEGTAVTIAWDANVATYTVVAGETTLINAKAVFGAGSTNLLLDTSVATLTVTATYATGYEAGKWTVTGSGAAISGSTFTVAPGAQLDIVSMEPLFQVGETHYGTFAEALAAAVAAEQSPATIKLLANYGESIAFSTGNIVLDLNGKTLRGGNADTYTIVNSGATLTIIDSATGGTVEAPTYGGALGAVLADDGLTTINAGTFESTVYTEKLQDPEATGDIVVNGGVFYDPDYESESKFYLAEYLGVGAEISYSEEYVTVGEPIIGTYTVTVTPTDNATYSAVYNDGGAPVEFVNDVAAVTVGKTITITATPGSGYEYASAPTGWTLSEGVITKEISAAAEVEIPAPTAESSWSQPSEDTPAAVDTALEADGFSTATGVVTNKVEYDALIAYVEEKTTASSPEGLTAAQKANAVLCYALQASAIPATEIVKEDVTIDAVETGDDGAVDLTVAIDGVTVGASVPTATLAKIVTAKGGVALGSMSTENVTVSGHAVETGKVKITVTPKADSPTSFFTSVIINK